MVNELRPDSGVQPSRYFDENSIYLPMIYFPTAQGTLSTCKMVTSTSYRQAWALFSLAETCLLQGPPTFTRMTFVEDAAAGQ